jgi:SNF2 family DNA or RNA helicase
MGLGKTLQVVAFMDGLIQSGQAETALIVMPVSLLANWAKEFAKWAPSVPVETFHGASKVQRKKKLERIRNDGGVLLTTYGLVASSVDDLNVRCAFLDRNVLSRMPLVLTPARLKRACVCL